MSTSPEWLLQEAVLAVHGQLVAEHGGSLGLRDAGLLESALARPRNLWEYGDPSPSLCELAAAYAFGLIRNHAFIDGNKRIAFTAALMFLELHGLRLQAPKLESYQQTVGMASNEVSEAEYAAWLTSRVVPIAPLQAE